MKLRLVSANFVLFVLLMPDHQSVFCFSNIFRNMWEKKFTIGGGGGGVLERVGRVTVNTPIFRLK